MSDPQDRTSNLVEEAARNLSSSATDFPLDTAQYFEDWLGKVKPNLEPTKNQLEHSAVAGPAPDERRIERGFEGRFEGTLRVDGILTGILHSQTGTLIISESGEAQCDLGAATVIIEGLVCGNIHATERVVLGSHARVFGNISSASISIAPGALFEGECHFLPSPLKPESEGTGSAHSAADPVSGTAPDSPDPIKEPGEEETELLAVAAAR